MTLSKFDWVLDQLRAGCVIYRESEPQWSYRLAGNLLVMEHENIASDGIGDGIAVFFGDDILAEDWNWRCPCHDWQYDADDPSIRHCRICETEEHNGAWANARAVWLKEKEDTWRRTAKALPPAGVTTHPEPVTCCERYPRCDCEETNRIYADERPNLRESAAMDLRMAVDNLKRAVDRVDESAARLRLF